MSLLTTTSEKGLTINHCRNCFKQIVKPGPYSLLCICPLYNENYEDVMDYENFYKYWSRATNCEDLDMDLTEPSND